MIQYTLLAFYAALVVQHLYLHEWNKALYWAGAAIITLAVIRME